MIKPLRALFIGCLWVCAQTAGAAPIVSVDVDLATPGVQSSGVVSLGSFVVIGIVVEGVEAADPLNAYEFDLDYDSLILTPTSVSDGGFLVPPVFVIEQNLLSPDVNLATTTIGGAGAAGAGLLATLVFDAIGLGTSTLDLNDVILSAPFGVQIATGDLLDASITVIPEPGTFVVLGAGLLLLAARGRTRIGSRFH